ncbi:MAG: hypothetical protein RIS17_408 [Pseudomonadota bacterium]
MNDTTPDSLIPYDDIVQDALRGVVSRVLQRISDEGGLPGGHHFYIAFRTRAPGVSIPKHLMERYPDEMTIVIQHRYWDLVVAPDHFSIGLSFNQMPAQLVVPYDAIVGFVDPAVNFALQFAPKDGEAPPEGPGDGPEPPETPPPEPEDGGSNVVTLDRFRRK